MTVKRHFLALCVLFAAGPAWAQPSSWTTDRRPNAAVDGFTGLNTTLGYRETWSASQGRWEPTISVSNGCSSNCTFTGTTAVAALTASGAVTLNGANTVGNAHSFGWADTSATRTTMSIDGSNTWIFNGTDAAGASRSIATMTQRSGTSSMVWNVPTTFNAAVTLNAVPFAAVAVPSVASGASVPNSWRVSTVASGSTTANNLPLGWFNVTSDTIAADVGHNINAFQINYLIGGGAMTGNRQAFLATIDAQTTSGNFGIGNNPFYVAAQFVANAHANEGGTGTLLSNSYGQLFGINPQVQVLPAATNFAGAAGGEFDIIVQSPVARKYGLTIVATPSDAYQGIVSDAAIKIGGAGGPGWRNGLQVGGDGSTIWPVPGTILSGYRNLNWASADSTSINGIDFQQVTFSGNFLMSKGFIVDGNGNQWIGRTLFAESSIDAKGSILNGTPTINSGGSGWTTGDIATDANNGVYTITAAAGAVTAVSVYRSPVYPALSGQPATLTITGNTQSVLGPGPTAVLNTSWTTSSTLALNASGGNTVVGTGSALATNATTGFLQVATMAGAPSGTVGAAGKAAIVVDTTNKKICYSTGGGTWECSAAFTP